jgi:hypothetical protein
MTCVACNGSGLVAGGNDISECTVCPAGRALLYGEHEHDLGECDLAIASDLRLWREYVDPHALMSADEWEAMSIQERLEGIRSCGW